MKTLSLKLPEALLAKLDIMARNRGENRSTVLRETIETAVSDEIHLGNGSCLDLAKDLAGCVNGPEDLSFNKRHMEDYGR